MVKFDEEKLMEKSLLNNFLDNSKYPTITKNIKSIHCTPTKFLITVSENTETKVRTLLSFGLFEVPLLYGKMLLMCNGKLAIKEIIDYFGEPGETNKILSYLENAMFRGWIDLHDSPLLIDVPRSGDTKYFYPTHLSIELTDSCNLNCKHCYREASFHGQYISKDNLLKAIDILANKGLRVVEFTGGEPLLHRDFFDIVIYAATRLDLVAILTNGMLVNKNTVKKLKPFANKVVFNISIDSSSSEFHDNFRGVKGSWERATNAVSLLVKEGFLCRVAMSVAPDNMDDIENVLLMSKNLGVLTFAWNLIMPFGRGAEILWGKVPKEKWIENIKLEKKLKKRYKNFLIFLPDRITRMMASGETNCGGGWRSDVLAPSGVIRPCINMPVGFLDIGDLFEEGIEIFKKPITSILCNSKVPRFETCKSCRFEGFCQSCLYRGLLASAQKENCNWEYHRLKDYVSGENLKTISNSCNMNKMPLFGL